MPLRRPLTPAPERGISLVELSIAVVVLGITILVGFSAFSTRQIQTIEAVEDRKLMQIAQSEAERLLTLPYATLERTEGNKDSSPDKSAAWVTNILPNENLNDPGTRLWMRYRIIEEDAIPGDGELKNPKWKRITVRVYRVNPSTIQAGDRVDFAEVTTVRAPER